MLNISLIWNSKNVIIASKIRTGSWRIKIIRYADASVVHFLFFYYLTFTSFSLSVRLHSLNSDEEPISFSHRKALHQKDILTKVVLLSHNNIDLIVKKHFTCTDFHVNKYTFCVFLDIHLYSTSIVVYQCQPFWFKCIGWIRAPSALEYLEQLSFLIIFWTKAKAQL